MGLTILLVSKFSLHYLDMDILLMVNLSQSYHTLALLTLDNLALNNVALGCPTLGILTLGNFIHSNPYRKILIFVILNIRSLVLQLIMSYYGRGGIQRVDDLGKTSREKSRLLLDIV